MSNWRSNGASESFNSFARLTWRFNLRVNLDLSSFGNVFIPETFFVGLNLRSFVQGLHKNNNLRRSVLDETHAKLKSATKLTKHFNS